MKTPILLCVSLNPAVDRRIHVPRFAVGEVNRATSSDPAAGGKAAHVAFAARALGAEVRWIGLLGGAEGESCRAGIEDRGVTPIPVRIRDRTRTNLELIDEASGAVTEVLEPGPLITEEEAASFLAEFEKQVAECPLAVASGSLPQGLPSSFYAALVSRAKDAGCQMFVDTSGEALVQALAAMPALIKPNRQEAEALLARRIETISESASAANELRVRGAETVIVSLGAQGAIVVGANQALYGKAPQRKALSAVGSGDSFLAGWSVGAMRGLDRAECLRLAIACGTANCLAGSPGVISPEAVECLSREVEISTISLR
jgi:1-phosphofructokinase family hexose kinase